MMSDDELLERIDRLYVGMLTPDEIDALDRAVKNGAAIRDYDHPGGFLGLAKVKVLKP